MSFINLSQWRPNMPPVSTSSKPEAHPCRLQHKPYTRPLTPGATTRYWKVKHAGEKTDSLQRPASLCLWRREAAQACSSTPEAGQLGTARDWKLLSDLGQRLCFSSEIFLKRREITSKPRWRQVGWAWDCTPHYWTFWRYSELIREMAEKGGRPLKNPETSLSSIIKDKRQDNK